MSDISVYDDDPPRGLQPGTALLLKILAGGTLIAAFLLGVAAVNQQEEKLAQPAPGGPPAVVAPTQTREITDGVLILAFVAIYVVALVMVLGWVVKDANGRGQNGLAWLVVVLLTQWVGFFAYVASRPQGELVVCHRCGNWKLVHALRCPHCRIGPRRPV